MPKVLIISAQFYHYHISVQHVFQQCGYDVVMETYDEPIHPFRGVLRWRHKFSLNREALREKSRVKYRRYIEGRFDEERPDLVFVFNGTILNDDTLDYFHSHGAKVVVWMYDSISNGKYQRCESYIDHADLFCCFEKSDVEYLASKGKKAMFLPSACATDVYFPIETQHRSIDILFVGNIYNNPKRVQLLEHIVERYPDKQVVIYGEYKPYYKNPIAWLLRRHRRQFKNVNVSPEEVNRLCAQSKVVLNIHNSQTFLGANPRFYEVCGTRSYQVCDANPYIEKFFTHGEVALYHNQEEMDSAVDWALSPANQTEREYRASQAYDFVIKGHTFNDRVAQILAWLDVK